MFGNGRVRCPGVAPCDLFLIILGKAEPEGKVDANVFRSLGNPPFVGTAPGWAVNMAFVQLVPDAEVIALACGGKFRVYRL